MLESILTLLHGAAVLLVGIALTVSFSKISYTKRNHLIFLGFAVFSGCLQLIVVSTLSVEAVWKMYPLVVHLPLILLLRLLYRKPLITAMAATFTSYLLLQPSKWAGTLAYHFTSSTAVEYAVRILVLAPAAYLAFFYLTTCLSIVFNKDRRSVCIFGFVPTVFYIFDYVTQIYTNLWSSSNQVVIEFMPFLLTLAYMLFCSLYYAEYEQKADAQRREQIIQIAVEQQTKEITAVRQIEQELRLLRHDMRMILSSLALSIENGDTDTAREMINAHITRIDGATLKRFCSNDIVNYVLSDYAARCKSRNIPFTCRVELQELSVDEIMFCSILSNALDNALNAQDSLPPGKCGIRLMMKNSRGRLLLSVENPTVQDIVFVDGIPLAGKVGHGYGTQSIRYLTERLGGNCQFSVQDGNFILRVVL